MQAHGCGADADYVESSFVGLVDDGKQFYGILGSIFYTASDLQLFDSGLLSPT
jgi:hypothetical protein